MLRKKGEKKKEKKKKKKKRLRRWAIITGASAWKQWQPGHEGSRIWVHTLSVSCCISMGGRSSCTLTPRATDITALAHSMRCTLFRCSSMNWVGGRLNAGSCFRMLKRGNIISDQWPMAVCRQMQLCFSACKPQVVHAWHAVQTGVVSTSMPAPTSPS